MCGEKSSPFKGEHMDTESNTDRSSQPPRGARPTSDVNKLLQQAMLRRYRVQDHSRSALLQLITRSRSPSALQAIATLDAERANLFDRIVTYAHDHHSITGLLRSLEGRNEIGTDDLHQDGMITLLELTQQIPNPPGSVEFQKIFLQARKRDLLDRIQFFRRRKARAEWEYVRTIRVEAEEGCSSEDPSARKIGLYYNPLSPLRNALLTDAVATLEACTKDELWKRNVLRDLLANSDLRDYTDQDSFEYYRERFTSHDIVPRTPVFDRHQVPRRSRDNFQNDLRRVLPLDHRRALVEGHYSHGPSGSSASTE